MNADRRLRRGEFPTRQLVLAWLAVCAIMLVTGAGRLVAGKFPDPDDVLRLVQVRDLLAGQSWFDVTQYRIDPPHGTAMHWTRIVDIPLALVIWALSPLLGQPGAERVALVLVPFTTFLVAALAVGSLAWRLLGARVAVISVLACGFLPALLFQYQPMRIDHHGWQVAMVAITLWAISRRDARVNGLMAGFAMAVGLSISLEILPMAAAFALVLFARWWFDHKDRAWLAAYMQALSLGLAVLYLATRGIALDAYCDAVSPAHVAFFLVAGLGTSLISQLTRLRGFGLLLLLALVGALAFATYAMLSPACIATPFATLDPLVEEYWYRLVFEGQPLWKQSPSVYIPALLQMLAAVVAAVMLYMRSDRWLRGWWAEYIFLLLASVALGMLVARSLAFASIIAALPLGWLTSILLSRIRQQRAPIAAIGNAVVIVVLLAPMTLVMAARALLPQEPAAVQNVASGACDVYTNAPLLAGLEEGTIMAPLDLGPAILLETGHSVVATGHHRANEAMAQVIRTFLAKPEEARRLLPQRDARYLALCTDMTEILLYANVAPEGLAASLRRGDVPEWLGPITLDGPPELAVYRIRN